MDLGAHGCLQDTHSKPCRKTCALERQHTRQSTHHESRCESAGRRFERTNTRTPARAARPGNMELIQHTPSLKHLGSEATRNM